MYRIVMVPITVNQLLDHAARTTGDPLHAGTRSQLLRERYDQGRRTPLATAAQRTLLVRLRTQIQKVLRNGGIGAPRVALCRARPEPGSRDLLTRKTGTHRTPPTPRHSNGCTLIVARWRADLTRARDTAYKNAALVSSFDGQMR